MPHLCLPLLLALLPAFVSQQAGGHILSLQLSDYSTDMPARTSAGEFCHRQRTPCDPTFEVEVEDVKHIRRVFGYLRSRQFRKAGNIPGVLLSGSINIGDSVPKRLKVTVTANDVSVITGDRKKIFTLKLAVNVTSFPITRRIMDRHGNFNVTVSMSLVCSPNFCGFDCVVFCKSGGASSSSSSSSCPDGICASVLEETTSHGPVFWLTLTFGCLALLPVVATAAFAAYRMRHPVKTIVTPSFTGLVQQLKGTRSFRNPVYTRRTPVCRCARHRGRLLPTLPISTADPLAPSSSSSAEFFSNAPDDEEEAYEEIDEQCQQLDENVAEVDENVAEVDEKPAEVVDIEAGQK